MSNAPDHLDPKEATEARLCAYLEGELPENERAEIEQHLSANPQHRKLLADLARTRQWVRAIPRESAPMDLAENFQGQVERSMLLEDPAMDRHTPIRWSQVMMVAAIILLTVGLGTTLVMILRGPNQIRHVAISPGADLNPTTVPSITADEKALALAPATPVASVVAPASAPTAAASTPTPVVVAEAGPGDRERRMVMADRADLEALTADQIKAKLSSSGYHPVSAAKSVCFVIKTDSPAAASDQLQRFFTLHELVVEAPAGLNNNDATDRTVLAMKAIREGGKANGGNAPDQQTQAGANQAVQNDQLAANQQARPNVSGVNIQNGNNTQNGNLARTGGGGGQNGSVGSVGNAADGAPGNSNLTNGSPPGTPPTQGQQGSRVGFGFDKSIADSGAANNNPTQNSAATNSYSAVQSNGTVQLNAATSLPAEQLFVAHNLSSLQVELLNATLSDNPNQSVRRIALSDEKVTVVASITKGQTLIITVPQLVGPGIDRSNTVKVADDGMITLPMIDPLPAAGVSVDELRKRIVSRYKDSGLIPDATVTIATSPATQPASQPATPPAPPALVDAAKPTTQPDATAKAIEATTQPDKEAGLAKDAGIDVVVVIEKSSDGDKAK